MDISAGCIRYTSPTYCISLSQSRSYIIDHLYSIINTIIGLIRHHSLSLTHQSQRYTAVFQQSAYNGVPVSAVLELLGESILHNRSSYIFFYSVVCLSVVSRSVCYIYAPFA